MLSLMVMLNEAGQTLHAEAEEKILASRMRPEGRGPRASRPSHVGYLCSSQWSAAWQAVFTMTFTWSVATCRIGRQCLVLTGVSQSLGDRL